MTHYFMGKKMYSNIHIENNSSLNKQEVEAVVNRAATYIESNKQNKGDASVLQVTIIRRVGV